MKLMLIALCVVTLANAAISFNASSETDRGIQVKRALHIEQPGMLVEAQVTWAGYVSNERPTLMEVIRFGAQRDYHFTHQGKANPDRMPDGQIRMSRDNGRTWEVIESWPEYVPIEGKRRLQRFAPNFVVNPSTGTLLRVYTTNEDIEGLLPWDKSAPNSTTRRIFSQRSQDSGRTWSEAEQVIMQGDEYDEKHWAPGIWYGEAGGSVEGVDPVPCPDGRLMLPFTAPMDKVAPRCSGALIGRWREDDSGVDWDMTAYATLPEEMSIQGAVEPSLAFLPDGRLYMLVRARVKAGMASPSCRYYFVSSDCGETWSEPEPMRYDDDDLIYSPACLGHVFRAAKNGKYYVITNILDKPTHGCDPRTILQIAELDTETLRILRDTVTVIERQNPEQGQPDTIRFSNWRRYEDRETGNIVVLMTACPGDVGRFEECGSPPHSYRYDIVLP